MVIKWLPQIVQQYLFLEIDQHQLHLHNQTSSLSVYCGLRSLRSQCPLAPPLALLGPPVATVVPAGSMFGVVLDGYDKNAAFPVPQHRG